VAPGCQRHLSVVTSSLRMKDAIAFEFGMENWLSEKAQGPFANGKFSWRPEMEMAATVARGEEGAETKDQPALELEQAFSFEEESFFSQKDQFLGSINLWKE